MLWARTVAAVRSCRATVTLAGVLLVVAGWQGVSGGDAGLVSRSFLFVSTRFLWSGPAMYGVADGRVWRVFTSGLVHFGVWPFVLNVVALALCGPVVERLLGWRRLVGLYAATTASAALAVYLFDSALVQWTGAAAPAVGVATCALVLLALTDGHRLRWVVFLLAVYCLAAWTEWYGFRPAPLIGAAVAGAAYAAIHAYLPAHLRPRATAAFWAVVTAAFVVRTVAVHATDYYTGGTYAGVAGWFHLLGAVTAEVVLFGVLVAIYGPSTMHSRARRLFEQIFDRPSRLGG